ncbi:hypothetical protein [Streptomyces sp. ME18-1-4]|uniref:hypothetical protein n=1 Tax=Streptomyces sp. ME18-1-4 TaxID=3028685 RepID=UPI0029B34897|nr:hypothetical protein [Streptomyces sp. ME18-1-4]MDX3240330.1 hypothetical protein [Streptomyces sp. ME18-1-4]
MAGLALAAVALGSLLPLLVTLYHFASQGRLRAVRVCLGIALGAGLPWLAVALALGRLLSWVRLSTCAGSGVGNAVLVALALALGMWAGSRRRLLGALRDQVEQLRVDASCAPSRHGWRSGTGSPARCTMCSPTG